MRVLIADDEDHARRRLSRLLEGLDVQVVDALSRGIDVPPAVAKHRPDALFLDIDMPGLDGLSIAETIPEAPPIVFVSGHRELAIEAYELAAVDYILKPVTRERLAKTLKRLHALSGPRGNTGFVPPTGHWMLRVVDGELERFVDAREVEVFFASAKYTEFVFEGRELLTRQSISELERQLHGLGFLRVRRDALVRVDAITGVRRTGGLELLLRGGASVVVARRAVSQVRRALGLASDPD